MSDKKTQNLTRDEIEFAKEIIDMIELRLSQGYELIELASQERKEIEWIQYEEDFDGRIKQFLANRK